jgi:hypothetical protein
MDLEPISKVGPDCAQEVNLDFQLNPVVLNAQDQLSDLPFRVLISATFGDESLAISRITSVNKSLSS